MTIVSHVLTEHMEPFFLLLESYTFFCSKKNIEVFDYALIVPSDQKYFSFAIDFYMELFLVLD